MTAMAIGLELGLTLASAAFSLWLACDSRRPRR